jgi:hypothetical protein
LNSHQIHIHIIPSHWLDEASDGLSLSTAASGIIEGSWEISVFSKSCIQWYQLRGGILILCITGLNNKFYTANESAITIGRLNLFILDTLGVHQPATTIGRLNLIGHTGSPSAS